jgi:hypothetical protein
MFLYKPSKNCRTIGAEWLREWSGIENGKGGKDAGKE